MKTSIQSLLLFIALFAVTTVWIVDRINMSKHHQQLELQVNSIIAGIESGSYAELTARNRHLKSTYSEDDCRAWQHCHDFLAIFDLARHESEIEEYREFEQSDGTTCRMAPAVTLAAYLLRELRCNTFDEYMELCNLVMEKSTPELNPDSKEHQTVKNFVGRALSEPVTNMPSFTRRKPTDPGPKLRAMQDWITKR